MQVNGAFHSIEKSRVIHSNITELITNQTQASTAKKTHTVHCFVRFCKNRSKTEEHYWLPLCDSATRPPLTSHWALGQIFQFCPPVEIVDGGGRSHNSMHVFGGGLSVPQSLLFFNPAARDRPPDGRRPWGFSPGKP